MATKNRTSIHSILWDLDRTIAGKEKERDEYKASASIELNAIAKYIDAVVIKGLQQIRDDLKLIG